MGGSGGGGVFYGKSPKAVTEKIRGAEAEASGEAFLVSLGELFKDALSAINQRDTKDTQEKIDDLLAHIEDDIDGSLNTLFGGSVAKHTYVDGISDVDTLVILNKSELDASAPKDVIDDFANTLKSKLGDDVEISKGKLSVTINYPDETSIQLLPAIKTEQGLKVPGWTGKQWSNINPEKFTSALTRHNEKLDGKLIPLIKLAKAINSTLPEAQQMSGYHIESMSIQAFRGYQDEKTMAKMLPHYFSRASDLVLKPIADSTGQSYHVDSYLGAANSGERQKYSHILKRTETRMMNATGRASTDDWAKIIGLSEE